MILPQGQLSLATMASSIERLIKIVHLNNEALQSWLKFKSSFIYRAYLQQAQPTKVLYNS